MKQKNVLVLSILLILTLVLTACPGSAATPAEPEAPTESEVATETETETEAETEVEVEATEAPEEEASAEEEAEEEVAEEAEEMEEEAPVVRAEGDLVIWADGNTAPALETSAAAFSDEYGLSVVVQEVDFGAIRDNLIVSGPAGEGPDIIVGAHDWLGELVTSGVVAPFDLGDKAADFSAPAIQGMSYNGELYGMPLATENIALVRNTDIVPDAPATWEEVLEISQELAADNDDDMSTNKYGFVRMEGDPYHFYPIMTAYGGYVFGTNDDGSYNPEDVGIDSEGALEAAQVWDDMVKSGLQPPAVDWETSHVLVETGQAGMTITGPWALGRLRDSGMNFAISELPSANEPGAPFMGIRGFMVSSFSEQSLLAQVYLTEFVATTEAMQSIYDADPRIPAYLPLLESLDDPDMAAFGEAGLNAQPMPAIPEMGSVWEAWGNAVTLVGQQGDDPVSAFTNAAEQVRNAIAGTE